MTNEPDGSTGGNAYRPMEEDIRQKLFEFCLCDQLFCVVFEPLEGVRAESGLSAEEVWCEALGMANRMGQTPRPDLAFRREEERLDGRYDTFIDGRGQSILRGSEAARQTECVVLTVLFFLLASASERADANPYLGICKRIALKIDGYPLFGLLRSEIRKAEDHEEREGHYVPFQDYMKCTLPDMTRSTAPLVDAGELVEVVRERCDEACYEKVVEVLSRYSDRHAHSLQREVNELRGELDALRRAKAETRFTKQVVVETGGNFFSESSFKDTNFNMDPKNLLPAENARASGDKPLPQAAS